MYSVSTDRTFVQRSFRVTRKQKLLFDVYTAGLLPQSCQFAVHLSASFFSHKRHAYKKGVPISGRFLQSHFRNAEIETLLKRRTIQTERWDRGKGICRVFRPTESFTRLFLEAGPTSASAETEVYVDLLTGKPSPKPPRSVVTGASRNPVPLLVRQAIESVKRSYVNVPAVERHVASLRAAYLALPDGPERARAVGRYFNDLSCLNSVLAQGAVPTARTDLGAAGDVWEYTPAFRAQRFGRIGEIGGGMQSANRAMKEAARFGIAECRNYDMEASQARLLQVAMRDVGIDSSWVDTYLNTPNAKHDAAARTGLSVDTWKMVLYSVLMGSRVPTPGQTAFSTGTVVTAIRDEVGDDRLDEVYGAFYVFVKPLLDDRARWHDHLEGLWVEANGRVSNVDKKTRITNAVGAVVAVEDLVVPGKPHKLRSRLASFVLTGLEASFAHRLAHMYSQVGEVLSPEHDGLIVLGEIEDALVEQAIRDAGLPIGSVVLVEKPFV
jgi:hypothetical protein